MLCLQIELKRVLTGTNLEALTPIFLPWSRSVDKDKTIFLVIS